MNVKSLFHVVLISFTLLLLVFISLWQVQQVSLAQGPIEVSKTLNRNTNVVRVGEVLSFTIVLTNNSAFSLTNVTLVDNYDSSVLAFDGAIPPQDYHDAATETITWTIVSSTTPLAPGGVVSAIVFFTAEHPQTAVVNAARAEDLVSSSGQLTYTAEASRTQEAIGGAAPIVKSLYPPGSTGQVGLPITFTHLISNDGAAIMTVLPLTDTYDPTFLEFNYAIPVNPDITQPVGTLAWPDLTTYFGDLPPFGSIIITTVFTATTQVVGGVNQASTEGAIDIYDNDLTAGADQVPITIIEASTPTAAPTATSTDDDEDEEEATPAVTVTPFPTQTPAAITTTTTGPLYLPETGWHPVYKWIIVPVFGLVLLALGWIIASRHKRPL